MSIFAFEANLVWPSPKWHYFLILEHCVQSGFDWNVAKCFDTLMNTLKVNKYSG